MPANDVESNMPLASQSQKIRSGNANFMPIPYTGQPPVFLGYQRRESERDQPSITGSHCDRRLYHRGNHDGPGLPNRQTFLCTDRERGTISTDLDSLMLGQRKESLLE
jgi:hypothetical protein